MTRPTTPLADLQRSLNALFGTVPTRRQFQAAAEAEQCRIEKNAQAKARRLAKKHGIELERDDDHIWVTCPTYWGEDAEHDPLEGNHFVYPGTECLQAVQVYVAAIADLTALG